MLENDEQGDLIMSRTIDEVSHGEPPKEARKLTKGDVTLEQAVEEGVQHQMC